jgi:hypothetical protein
MSEEEAERNEPGGLSLPTMNDTEEELVPADEQERVKPLDPVDEEVPTASETNGRALVTVFEVEPIPAGGKPIPAALHPPVEAIDPAGEPSLEPVRRRRPTRRYAPRRLWTDRPWGAGKEVLRSLHDPHGLSPKLPIPKHPTDHRR